MKLTKRVLDSVKPNSARDVFMWDDEVSGFGLRVKSSGVRSFIVQYRNGSGVSRRITLGKFGVLTPDEAQKMQGRRSRRRRVAVIQRNNGRRIETR